MSSKNYKPYGSYISFITGIQKMEEPVCLQNLVDVPMYIIVVTSSSVAVVILVVSITFFITGFAFGHYRGKRSTKGTHQSETHCSHKVPIYDDVLPSDDTHQEPAFRLRGNVAYLSPRSVVVENQ